MDEYPLFLFLHGGGGNRSFLENVAPIFNDLWEKSLMPEMVVVTPSCSRSFYMNYKDGSEKWENFIIQEFLPHLRNEFNISSDSEKTIIGGVSMGGLGSLRMGFKYLGKFKAIISFEPGIEPAFEWKDVEPIDKFYRNKEFMEKIFGSPFDKEYWKINNPAYIVRNNADKIRKSGIKIYLEVGTEDFFGLDRGAEFLHRILYDKDIKHEFRYVYGADHLGKSFNDRFWNGFTFINRIFNPLDEDIQVIRAREYFLQIKDKALRNELDLP